MAYATAGDLQDYLPGIDAARAGVLVELASTVIDANTHSTIPTTPVPDRVKLACLMQAARIARTDDKGQQVVNESVSGYSVGYAQPGRSDYALLMADDVKALLAPWRNTSMVADTLEGEYEARIAAEGA